MFPLRALNVSIVSRQILPKDIRKFLPFRFCRNQFLSARREDLSDSRKSWNLNSILQAMEVADF